MIINNLNRNRLRHLLEFSVFGIIAGLIFQLIKEDGYINHIAFIMGFSLGFGFWILDVFIFARFRKYFSKLPLFLSIIFKTILFLIIINVFSGLVGFIVGFLKGQPIEEFYFQMTSRHQLVINIYTLFVYLLVTFYIQINLLIGEGTLLKFLFGRYRKPTAEYRIFMFLDLKSSTTLAEKLGLRKYYSLLNDFFHEISSPVRNAKAEIYQYVGDEVVFTWKMIEGLTDTNCLKIFFEIKKKINKKREYYLNKYGEIPRFKAGIHFGKVISAQIGDIKREIVYNGDVLNTSARIQEQCNIFDRELIISDKLLKGLFIQDKYNAEELASVRLRGKEKPLVLHSITKL